MKKLTAFVLSAMMVLSLAACGAKTETPADTSTPAADATKPAEVAKLTSQWKPVPPVRKWHWPTATTLYP